MSASLLEDEEAERIAGDLLARYGGEAVDHVRRRAEQAQAVGDELAYGAWQAVGEALALLGLSLAAD